MRLDLFTTPIYFSISQPTLHVLRGGGTGDNFDQFSGNDGLTGSVEQNLVLADHLTGVLGGVL